MKQVSAAPQRHDFGAFSHGVASLSTQSCRVHLLWNRFWKSNRYRRGSDVVRRLIDLRISVAFAVRRRRKSMKWSQKRLADEIDCSRATISALEQAHEDVKLEHAVMALLVLGATDDDVARAFNAGTEPQVATLRRRIALPIIEKLRR